MWLVLLGFGGVMVVFGVALLLWLVTLYGVVCVLNSVSTFRGWFVGWLNPLFLAYFWRYVHKRNALKTTFEPCKVLFINDLATN